MLAIQLLHLLVHMRTVENIGTLHSLTVALDFGRIVVHLRTEIPQFKNMKALLGTNGDTDNGVFGVGRDQTKNGSGSVSLKGLNGICLGNLDTVGTAVNVGAMLP